MRLRSGPTIAPTIVSTADLLNHADLFNLVAPLELAAEAVVANWARNFEDYSAVVSMEELAADSACLGADVTWAASDTLQADAAVVDSEVAVDSLVISVVEAGCLAAILVTLAAAETADVNSSASYSVAADAVADASCSADSEVVENSEPADST